jgi:transcriptional regulator GlxA family with amidase domain
MSREGFSRMFARRHGMPPHAFWLMARLNHARGLLRAGEDIAGVAAETGFADQSHLGRWFRRAFGVTPGRYRSGWPPLSQTFQTRP